jgi:HEAT repeat protein
LQLSQKRFLLCFVVLCRAVQVVPALLHALTDPEGDVRGAAAFALGQFSEYLQPDITSHHQEVLPGVFRLLQDPSMDVQERACYGEGSRCTLWIACD